MNRRLRALVFLLLFSALAGCSLLPSAPQPAPTPAGITLPPPAVVSSTPQPVAVPSATLPAPTVTASPLPPTPTPVLPAQYLVLVSMDGARPDYLELGELPNLRALMQTGVYYTDAWVGALENSTPAGHVQMSTGAFPRRNGVPGHVIRNLAAGERIELTADDFVLAGGLAAVVERSGVPTLAGLVKAKDPQGVVIAVSGYKAYAAQALGVGPADYIIYTEQEDGGPGNPDRMRPLALPGHAPEMLNDPALEGLEQYPGEDNAYTLTLARKLFETYRPRALLINLPESDTQGHRAGGEPGGMSPIMAATDAALGELMEAYRQAGLYDQTLWVVLSDHGMSDKRQVIIPTELFANLGISLAEGESPSLPYLFLKDPGRAAEIAEMLASSRTPGIRGVYYRVQDDSGYHYQPAQVTRAELLPELNQAYLTLLDTYAGFYSPDVLVMTAEGVVFDKQAESVGGEHSMINWTNQHIPILFSGPGVQRGLTSYAPARLVDVLPTIARLMDLPAAEMDGLPLADALVEPNPAELAAWQELTARLSPLRDAFEAEGIVELGVSQ